MNPTIIDIGIENGWLYDKSLRAYRFYYKGRKIITLPKKVIPSLVEQLKADRYV